MIPNAYRRVVLVRRPPGEPAEADFRIEQVPMPEPGPRQVLVRNIYMSLDPYMRGRMREAKSYAAPVEIGEVMTGGTVGEVVKSNHPDYKVGDIVEDRLGWQEYGVGPSPAARKVDPALAPISTANGVLGMPGMTAYFGLFEVGRPKAGETVVVSAASGAVGQIVGQLAKIAGCRAVGIAGGPKKCAFVKDALGFDACIDYKAGNDLGEALKAACPDGGSVRLDFPIQRCRARARPAPARSLRRSPREHARVHRLGLQRPVRSGHAPDGRVGAQRPPQIQRGHRRRPRAGAARLHRPVAGREFRQIAGEARAGPDGTLAL
jgi:hypothetical protein